MGSESYKKPIGRPATANRRVVIPLNLQQETDRRLTELSLKTNKSKSSIADEAISQYLDKA